MTSGGIWDGGVVGDCSDGESVGSDERKGSNLGALFNIVCSIAGAGTLGMPYSFRQGGWVAAGFIVLSSVVAWYTGVIMVECLYYDPGKRLSSYPAIGEAAFGRAGRVFVQFFHYTIVLGVSTLYIMLAGINIEMIVSGAGGKLEAECMRLDCRAADIYSVCSCA
ncbi:hypothetical protein DSO57_1034936 [Entomophthora muscae]|uniref:Uncharacterized protein n=1 Tax=Entomophthora muscae TaxID=34485 RepID=A0ACC2TAN7_9FUNG|nr:hypothetical protein DSO57_1034936 [Entomophthora muscae]